MLLSFFRWFNHTSFYLTNRVYMAGFGAALLFALSFFLASFFTVAVLLLVLLALAVLVDAFLLYHRRGVYAHRKLADRLSNGDENSVALHFENHYPFQLSLTVIDELPFQFRAYDWKRQLKLDALSAGSVTYVLRPVERGSYAFGIINVYAASPLGLVVRRFRCGAPVEVKVYPSYIQMKRYQLTGVASTLAEKGVRRMRKLGHSMEFEQIKPYVPGDDYRTVNWPATARHGDVMVNTFVDERSQQIYCLVNKGRVMKMPFEGLTLLDHSINAALVLLNTALGKGDRAGLITFAQHIDTFLPADKKSGQLNQVLESLYRQHTAFMEPDFEQLFSVVRNRVTQRSLLVLFTNFESVESLERELPALRRLAHYHLLLVIFFENTELEALTGRPAQTTEDIYIRTIAEKYRHEKLLIARALQQQGILTVLTTPEKLTINVLNKYLEVKNRQSL